MRNLPSLRTFEQQEGFRYLDGQAFSVFGRAGLERCEYCGCNRHRCGCDDRFEYEQIRDNPALLSR